MTALVDPALLDSMGDTPEAAAERLQHEVQTFESVARARADWFEPRAGGAWSPAQLTEHVLLANASFAKVVHLLGSGRDLPDVPRAPSTMQNGRIVAPAFLVPGPGVAWEELEARWRDVHARFVAAAAHPADLTRTFWHPSFGELNAFGWTRAAAWHTRHHRRQLA